MIVTIKVCRLMGDMDHGFICGKLFYGFQNRCRCILVKCGGWLIEEQNIGIFAHCTGYSYALGLSARKLIGAVPEICVDAFRK